MTMDARSDPGQIVSPTSSSAGLPTIILLDDGDAPTLADPGTVVLTCANCGATMDERKCKLICRCGYFLSCSDYY
jgi:hypothetical protein